MGGCDISNISSSRGFRSITYYITVDDAVTPVRRPDSSIDDEATKSNRDVEIKQERMETSSSHEDEESPLGGKTKKLRIEVADAESNTLNSGECTSV